MRNLKSFVDVLFILLLGARVLLSESVRIGSLELAPIEDGSGGASIVRADQVRLLVITEDALLLDGTRRGTPRELAGHVQPGDTVLLVSGDDQVRHHRVMGVWSAMRKLGVAVQLGARPASAPQKS